jgi:tRNA-2-methylthio-N6-dimethylallyladenosine synthase
MPDDVPAAEKWRRFRAIEKLQETIVREIHASYQDQTVDVLFEDKVKKRWRGRTPTNKLVFVETDAELRGRILPVRITWTGPWSMLGVLVD